MIGQTCGLYRKEETEVLWEHKETDLLEDEIEGESRLYGNRLMG
jgi:hypothetical protein